MLLPFNALPYFKFMFRELANEGTFYPLMLIFLLYVFNLIHGKKIRLSLHYSVNLLAMLILWVSISGVANIWGISQSFTKGRSGIEKFVFQYVLLLFVVLSSLFIYDMGREDSRFLYKFRKYSVCSLVLVGLYCVFEVLAILGEEKAAKLLSVVDYYIRDEDAGVAIFKRLRSVSGEPSYFAMYISFVFPWVFSCAISSGRYRWFFLLLIACLVGLVILTFSRSAYGILGVQIIILILASARYGGASGREFLSVVKGVAILALVIVGAGVFEVVPVELVGNVVISLLDLDDISNIGRYGSQLAAFSMAVDNPVFGVGFGQYGFNMPAFVPDWALISAEIQEWMSTSSDSAWAPALGLYARISGELGFVGLALWIGIWGGLFKACLWKFKKNCNNSGSCDVMGLALLVSMFGVLMAGFNSDSLRFFGYWILLALCWVYLEENNYK